MFIIPLLRSLDLPPSFEDLSSILMKCIQGKDYHFTLSLHALLCKHGLDVNPLLGNHLVSIMIDDGNLSDAQRVFNKVLCQYDSTWNSLVVGHIRFGKIQCALKIYSRLLIDEFKHPDKPTFVALLKVCVKLKDVERGLQIHAHIARRGLLKQDLVVGSMIVCMYAKFGLISQAQKVFENLPVRSVVSWTALIAGYADHGHADEAFQSFEQMCCEGSLPDAFTFSCILKTCGSLRALEKGHRLHASIEKQGLIENDTALGNSLVDLYSRNGAFVMAHQVFDKLLNRNVVSWTSIIAAYVEHGHAVDAIHCFEQMKYEGVSPDVVTLGCILKACSALGAADKGEEIFVEIERHGLLWKESRLGNSLLDMYAKCGMLANALKVFDRLTVRDAVSWNAVITGYFEHGLGNEALQCFESMQLEGITPNASTFVSALNACGLLQALDKGIDLHIEIERLGLSRKDPVVEHALLHMYIKCDSLALAQQLLSTLVVQSVISWTTLIARYTDDGYEIEALKCLDKMQHIGIMPNAITYISALKSCGNLGATHLIAEIYAEVERRGLPHDCVLATSIMSAYAKCGLLFIAREFFNRLSPRNVVSWNALMVGYVDHGYAEEALKCFEEMQGEGVLPDVVSFTCVLNACSNLGATEKGIELHAMANRQGLLESDLAVANTIINMYVEFSMLTMAQQVFDKLPTRDVVSWTTLISGCAKLNYSGTAVNCYEHMQQEQISPNAVSLVCMLKACGSVGALDKVREVHCEIERKGLLEEDIFVGNSLVDSYIKCGVVATAREVFDGLLDQHVVSWTSLMAGYTQLGENERVFVLVDQMLKEGRKPDPITFMVILNACSSVGFADKGQMFLEVMTKDYDIVPTSEHHACMVECLSRIGYLDKAADLMKKPSLSFDFLLWHKLLIACKSWGNMELGRHAFEKALHV